MKLKTCKVCKEKFEPERQMQAVCSVLCAIEQSKKKKIALERIQTASERVLYLKAKERIKTRSEWIKEAQNSVNAYVRYRDKDLPCISCGNPLGSGGIGGSFDAGHYRSVGSANHLRFDAERNIHGQCKRCNRYLGGNYANYRIGLVDRLGIETVESLEADNEPRKWSIDELKEIKSTYKAKLKELKNGRSGLRI